MTRRDPVITFKQILAHAEEAVQISGTLTFETYLESRIHRLALFYLVEIVGEAATRISPELRKQFPEIPWGQMIALRNRLIHGYDAINLEVVWDILQNDLPPLCHSLRAVIANLEEERKA